MNELEYRFQPAEEGTEIRIVKDANGKNYLEAYGIVFNSNSRMLYRLFIERILPEAINDSTDMSEIVCKYNHDINRTLGTTWGGTLTWTRDSKGIKYRVELLDDNENAKEVMQLAARGDLRGSSFEFDVAQDGYRWITEKIGEVEYDVREIFNFRKISDLSPVIRPAYPGTENTIKTYKRQIEEARGGTPPKEDTPPAKPEAKKKYWFSR